MKKIMLIIGCLMLAGQCTLAAAQEEAKQFEGFNLEGYTEGGQKSWDVTGDKADIQQETIEIYNVDANRYGDQKMNLKAQKGTIDKTNGNIQLEKDVVITSDAGTQLKTDSLTWEKDNDLVSTDDAVFLTDNKGMTAEGQGLRAKPGLKTAKMNKDVTIKVDTQAAQKESAADPKIVTITCDGPMEIDQQSNMAILRENVLAVQEDKTLQADLMEVYFDPETQAIQQMVCVGNVIIKQGENLTHSDKAVYNANNQKVILSGRPKMIFVTEGEGGIASFKN